MWPLREVVSLIFALIALGCSIASLINVQTYSLPFPVAIPSLNLISAVIFVAVTLSRRKGRLTPHSQTQVILSGILSYVAFLVPPVLAVLSATFVFPADVRACLSELQWKYWYINKNEAMIRSIQDTLRCCGFNSMPDRAWPFPSKDTDARTCQRTSGFRINCAPLWQGQLRFTAVLCMLASILIHFSVLLFLYDLFEFSNTKIIGQPEQTTNERTRLLESTTAADIMQATFDEEERRRQIGQGLT